MPESIYEVGSKNYLLKNMAQNKKLILTAGPSITNLEKSMSMML